AVGYNPGTWLTKLPGDMAYTLSGKMHLVGRCRMPWKECRAMDERARFIRDWERDDLTFTELCEHYGISRPIGYKWLGRYEVAGVDGLKDRSRRPHTSPNRTPPEIVERILEVRRKQDRKSTRLHSRH